MNNFIKTILVTKHNVMSRSTRGHPDLFVLPDDFGNVHLNQLRSGGRAGRLRSGHQERQAREENDNEQWDLEKKIDPATLVHFAPPVPLCLPCGEDAPAPPPIPPPKNLDENIIVCASDLKQNMEKHLACKKCVRKQILRIIHKFTSWYDEKLWLTLAEVHNSPPDSFTEFMTTLDQIYSPTKMWRSYTHTPEYRYNMDVMESSKLDVTIRNHGLATYITSRCSYKTRDTPTGHHTNLHAPKKDNTLHGNSNAQFDINKQSVLMAHHLGTSWVGVARAFATLGIRYLGQHSYEKCEDVVGNTIKTVAEEAMKEAIKEEITLSKEAGEGTHVTEEYGELPALTMGTDGCWQRRASGRRYDSASGCVHFIGVRSKKVCGTRLNINRCYICARIERLEGKKQKAKRVKKKKQQRNTRTKLRTSKRTAA